MDLPGGDGFVDITRLFSEAAEEMTSEELIMAQGFTLNEAMSAIEIGDPRMDSGAAQIENESRPKFDPLVPLIPEEICYILDRALACEMHWHAGNALAQTVFTCRYVHHMNRLDALHKAAKLGDGSPQTLLVGIVLRAGIIGLLKCCDLSYRELVKGQVIDCEDWQGEKSNVSLLEGRQTQDVLMIIEDALLWLQQGCEPDMLFREEIFIRLQLRNLILRLLALDLPLKAPFIAPLVGEARHLLSRLRSSSISIPTTSVALIVFDPHITRELHSIMPIRPLDIPNQEESWSSLSAFLDGWETLCQLSICESLLRWDAFSLTQANNSISAPKRLPLMRSLAQTVFSSGSSIMERFNISWLIDRFFLEIAHISFTLLLSVFDEQSSTRPAFEQLHTTICRLLLQHIWSYYQNRPRHRRHSMKTALDWHSLYDVSMQLCSRSISNENRIASYVLACVPPAILHWRSLIVRDIVLSGFELELYTDEERTFAYWYLTKVLNVHEDALQKLLDVVPQSTPAHSYLSAQLDFLRLLREMATGCFQFLTRPSKFDLTRRWTNFTVRYKWILSKSYIDIPTPDPFLPFFEQFLQEERQLFSSPNSQRRENAQKSFEAALGHAIRLGLSAEKDESLSLCRAGFLEKIGGVMRCCEEMLRCVSKPISEGQEESCLPIMKDFEWDLAVCAWFPRPQPSAMNQPSSFGVSSSSSP